MKMYTILFLVVAIPLLAPARMTWGGKPDKPGGGKDGGGDDGGAAAYALVDLRGLTGGSWLQSQAFAVNEPDTSGSVQLAGNSVIQGEFRAVHWDVNADGTSVEINDISPGIGERASRAYAINDSGIAVFNTIYEDDPTDPMDEEGAAWVVVPGELPQELPKLDGVTAYATGINDVGEIVGYIVVVENEGRRVYGALWELDASGVPGLPANLGSFIPEDISHAGVMAGQDDSIGVAAIAFFESSFGLQVNLLGALAGHSWSSATAISSDGTWVVGYSNSVTETEAFRWSAATGMVGLGRLAGASSEAADVNDFGDVVGWSNTDGGKYSETAVLWKDGQILDLNEVVNTKAHLGRAEGINNAGHIAGYMDYPKPISEQHGCLLVPPTQ